MSRRPSPHAIFQILGVAARPCSGPKTQSSAAIRRQLCSAELMTTRVQSSILVIDIGGHNVKVLGPRPSEVIKIPSGKTMMPNTMVERVRQALGKKKFSRISIGFPGPVKAGKVVSEPQNLGPGWVGFDFEKAFGHPVRVINDAALQALGSYEGGRMLFLGLGTGLGSTLIIDGIV